MSTQKLDKVDAKIMQVLSKDGRISWRDLADQIGLSLTPTLRRIRRLESEGVITGYSAQFDEQKLGFGRAHAHTGRVANPVGSRHQAGVPARRAPHSPLTAAGTAP